MCGVSRGRNFGNPVPVSLLDKPGRGNRPIGITPLLAALYLQSHGDITTEWEDRRMNFWEDAVRGSSALMAGLQGRMLDECAVALGQPTLGIHWDLEKFHACLLFPSDASY